MWKGTDNTLEQALTDRKADKATWNDPNSYDTSKDNQQIVKAQEPNSEKAQGYKMEEEQIIQQVVNAPASPFSWMTVSLVGIQLAIILIGG